MVESVRQANLFITAGSITNRVGQLQRRGLLARRPDPVSRRRVLIGLTTNGRKLADTVAPRIVDASARAASQLERRGLNLHEPNHALANVTPALTVQQTPAERANEQLR